MVKERLANKATECQRATIKKSDFFFFLKTFNTLMGKVRNRIGK